MPLLDHFHLPLNPRARWESFHQRWATVIADTLDSVLPPRFFAQVGVHLGRDVAADVVELDSFLTPEANGTGGGVAVQPYAPPAPPIIMPAVFVDEVEIVVREAPDARLLAVIEIISPANKQNPEARRNFAAKCAAYLQHGVGLLLIDVVTESWFNLHNEWVRLLQTDEAFLLPDEPAIYTVAYRPRQQDSRPEIDVWPTVLEIGQPLPTIPLALRGITCIPLDLEATYMETCRRTRLI